MVDIPNVKREERIGSAFNDLFEIISMTGKHQEEGVEWNMEGVRFLHPFFLAPLAIYRQSSERMIESVNMTPRMESYFETVHFEEPLTIGEATEELEAYERRSYLPICRFDLHNYDEDGIQGPLQRLILKQSKASERLTTPLAFVLGELICNMTQHSRGKYGYVYSQYLRREGCINLVLADDGITVLGSYVRSRKYLEEIDGNDATALRLACEGKSSKDRPLAESRGYGLSSSKRMLVEGFHGSFFMLSGGAFHRHNDTGSVYINLPESVYWEGTIILMKIPTEIPHDFDFYRYMQ